MERLDAPAAAEGCPDLPALRSAIESPPRPSELRDTIRRQLHGADERLAERFWAGEDVAGLVRARAWVVEQLVLLAWQTCVLDRLDDPSAQPCLVAVGGFGRGELHPHSDVDLLILVEEPVGVDEAASVGAPAHVLQEPIEQFVQLLWDAGFYLGHSVRTVTECIEEARADVSTATSLMESRLLSGPAGRFERLSEAIGPAEMWDAGAFFSAKLEEQQQRHARFNDTAYNLEPNIKEGPGGLRDIQMIAWVTRRHLGVKTLHALVDHGFLTEPEFETLQAGKHLLWRIRYALQLLAGRSEDRLLFDFQHEMSRRFGYSDATANLAVEQFMQLYYRNVMQLERLIERLLQLFEEELLYPPGDPAEPLTEEFCIQHGFVELARPDVFARRPAALMELFVLLARNPELKGVRASTVRAIRDHLHLIDDEFRRDETVNSLFLELLSQPQGIYTQLRRMNRYGVLAAYLPVFGNIVGRMQYDLFHVYTVDQHTLFVVRNLRRFAYGKYAEHFPHAQQVIRRIDQPQLLFLAALFHDIAKGREGDHSELGAEDAAEFCARLDLGAEDRDLVSWLVRHHLMMSRTAQRKDLSDPATIQEFAGKVRSMRRLHYLYLLTMADIAATSPKLWTGWKNSLLWDLYLSAGNALRRGLENPVERETRIRERRSRALSRLLRQGMSAAAIHSLWDVLPHHAFLRLTAPQLEWATTCVVAAPDPGEVVEVRAVHPHGVSQVLVCVADHDGLFAAITSVFDEMGLNVLAARVMTTRDSRSFDLFQVADQAGKALMEQDASVLRQRLLRVTSIADATMPVTRRVPRRLKHFSGRPVINFSPAPRGQGTQMDLECNDRPGLLSRIAVAFNDCGVQVHDARIATFGEKVEDTFVVSDRDHRPLSSEACDDLAQAIAKRIDQ